jgi:hypothetical protein
MLVDFNSTHSEQVKRWLPAASDQLKFDFRFKLPAAQSKFVYQVAAGERN